MAVIEISNFMSHVSHLVIGRQILHNIFTQIRQSHFLKSCNIFVPVSHGNLVLKDGDEQHDENAESNSTVSCYEHVSFVVRPEEIHKFWNLKDQRLMTP